MQTVKTKRALSKLKRTKSVNTAMWGYFCLLATVLIICVEIVFSIVAANTFPTHARDTVTRIGVEIKSRVSAGEDIKDVAAEYREEGVTIFVVAVGGRIVLPAEAEKLPPDIEKELKTHFSDGQKEGNVIFSTGTSENYAVIVDCGGEDALLIVSYPLKFILKATHKMQGYFLIAGIVTIFAGALIAYSFSQRLSSGIQNISDNAVQLAKGDYTVQFANADYKELAALSDTMNFVRDEVKKSEDFQHEILANVTHDLKTPLTMIKAYASMVMEISGDNPEKRNKHLQVIIDESNRLTELVNDILSVSKLRANLDEINMKVFNITEQLYGIINKFDYLREMHGYKIVTDIDNDLYTRADEQKIDQVIYNLLGNAANYTGEDKTVFVSLRLQPDTGRIRFSVRDTGKGIPKEQLGEIWNRYYRVKENHSRPVKGTGLGLNIVKAILENHSFDFGVDSEVDKGSTFWIDFPSVPSEPEEKTE